MARQENSPTEPRPTEPRPTGPRGLSPGGEVLERTDDARETAAPGAAPDEEGSDTARAGEAVGRLVAGNSWVLRVTGAVSILAGILAIAVPFLASITAAILVGGLLVGSGAVGLVSAFRREGWHVAAAFALSLVSVVAGLLMLFQPIAGILALTTLVIAYLGASGILRIWYGARQRDDGGGWMIATGALSIVLALLLWFGFPFNAVWVPGLLLGIDLILWGALLLAFGFGPLSRRRTSG